MSNDYTPTRLIPIEEFLEKSKSFISSWSSATYSEFFDKVFTIRQGEGKKSNYLMVYVKEEYVVGFTMSGDPTNNHLLEIIQRTFEVKMINFDYHWQHSL